jgi:uncharacterized iron-regulated membrane protein
MKPRMIRRWSWLHRWTSLICTAFLLTLCVSGLPLVFRDEIDDLLYPSVAPAAAPDGTPDANLDEIAAAAMSRYPGKVVQFLIWDRDDPDTVRVAVGKSIDADPAKNSVARVDKHTAKFLDAPEITARLTNILLRLHAELCAGTPGKLFLGVMGMLFVAATVSGVVLYAPSMRKLDFGTVRRQRSPRLYWLDLHNLLGIVTVAWTLVVGVTGAINTWADVIQGIWQRHQLAAMIGPFDGTSIPQPLASLQTAVDAARGAMPDMTPLFVAYPGTAFTSRVHYAVFMRGNSARTSRLFKPVLVDASTGQLADVRDLPWYVSALLLSQPLHFGDYGGVPLKIIWGALDAITIVVLGSGLYLWLRRFPRRGRWPKFAIGAQRPTS